MVEYGALISMSVGNILNRFFYSPDWTTVVLIIVALSIVIYGVCKL
jgi:hypothetical protein